jgi:FKBP-type peptidyl-prolyl cis-trans isomerase
MKSILGTLLLFSSIAIHAQQKKPVPVKKPVPAPATAPSLKTLTDSASYAIGLSVANFYSQQGIKNINQAMVSKAISDVLGGKKPLLDENQANKVIMKSINEAQTAKSKTTIDAGRKFLAENKLKPNIKTTASGLQYEVFTEGSGAKPLASDSVTVHYRGTLLNGTEFDNSYSRGEPITFTLSGVIKGWTEALQLMNVGSKYKLYIPHELAYGTNDMGPIPGGSVLVFEVELLKIPGKN